MKFKVGDIVRIIKYDAALDSSAINPETTVGYVGEITFSDKSIPPLTLSYVVEFARTGERYYYAEEEIALASPTETLEYLLDKSLGLK